MRVATRILLWKLGAAAAALALLFALMHVLLPGLARRREQQRLGEGYERVETERLEIWVPRGTPLERRCVGPRDYAGPRHPNRRVGIERGPQARKHRLIRQATVVV